MSRVYNIESSAKINLNSLFAYDLCSYSGTVYSIGVCFDNYLALVSRDTPSYIRFIDLSVPKMIKAKTKMEENVRNLYHNIENLTSRGIYPVYNQLNKSTIGLTGHSFITRIRSLSSQSNGLPTEEFVVLYDKLKGEQTILRRLMTLPIKYIFANKTDCERVSKGIKIIQLENTYYNILSRVTYNNTILYTCESLRAKETDMVRLSHYIYDRTGTLRKATPEEVITFREALSNKKLTVQTNKLLEGYSSSYVEFKIL